MTDQAAVNETEPLEWLSASETMRKVLLAMGGGMGSRAAARRTIAKRAHHGLIKTRARLFCWQERRLGASKPQQYRNENVPLPLRFWWAEGEPALEQDWMTGDFATWIDQSFRWQAFGVEFDRRGVEQMLVPVSGPLLSSVEAPLKPSAGQNRGRPAANWWPDFAEELAFYIHECGLPEGQGAVGQSEVIEEVFNRLAAAGKPEPNRTSVQRVVSNVLRRSRSAG